MASLESILVPIHRDGYKFIAVGLVLTLGFFYIWAPLGWLILILTIVSAFFFRDPDRVTPVRDKLIVAPADGVIAQIAAAVPPEELEMGEDLLTRISIYISLSDVHIQRMPASGTIERIVHRSGAFASSYPVAQSSIAASDTSESGEDNERQSVLLRTVSGREVAIVQIAGRLARRIICNATTGQEVRAGERYGLIRFGSRVDIYLATTLRPQVIVGQRAVAGETILVDERSRERQRKGEVR